MKKNFDKIQEKLEQKDLKGRQKKMAVTGKGTFMLKNILDKKTGKQQN